MTTSSTKTTAEMVAEIRTALADVNTKRAAHEASQRGIDVYDYSMAKMDAGDLTLRYAASLCDAIEAKDALLKRCEALLTWIVDGKDEPIPETRRGLRDALRAELKE